MKSIRLNFFLGLFVFSALLIGNGGLFGQILKNTTSSISDAGKKVSNPIKETRNSVQSITEPIDDVRRAGQDVTQPVRDVKREVDGLQKDVDRVESDVKGLKNDASNAKNQVRGNRSNRGSSAASSTRSGKGTAPTQADKARADSVYRSRLRTGTTVRRTTEPAPTATVQPDKSISSQTVLLPPNAIKQRPRQPEYAYNDIDKNRPATLRQGYLDSPAKPAIDRAEFDIETLEELFEAAIWTGPDSVHTARSIEYMLQELRDDINTIRRTDPEWDTIYYEDRYRKWRALYRRNTDPLSEFN